MNEFKVGDIVTPVDEEKCVSSLYGTLEMGKRYEVTGTHYGYVQYLAVEGFPDAKFSAERFVLAYRPFVEGQWAFSSGAGWGRVELSSSNDPYQLSVKGESFTQEGKMWKDDKYPSLYHEDKQFGTKPPVEQLAILVHKVQTGRDNIKLVVESIHINEGWYTINAKQYSTEEFNLIVKNGK